MHASNSRWRIGPAMAPLVSDGNSPKPETVRVANDDRQFKYGGHRAQAHPRRHRKANGRAAHPGWSSLPKFNLRGFPGFAASQPAKLARTQVGTGSPASSPKWMAPGRTIASPARALPHLASSAFWGGSREPILLRCLLLRYLRRRLQCRSHPRRPPLDRHRWPIPGTDAGRSRRTRRILGGADLARLPRLPRTFLSFSETRPPPEAVPSRGIRTIRRGIRRITVTHFPRCGSLVRIIRLIRLIRSFLTENAKT